MSSEETERLISPSGRLDSEERATYATMVRENQSLGTFEKTLKLRCIHDPPSCRVLIA